MIVDVPEVEERLGRDERRVFAAREPVGDVALRQDRALETLSVAFQEQHPFQDLAIGPHQHQLLDRGDLLVDALDDGVEVIDDDVEQGVGEERGAAVEHERVRLGAPPHLIDGADGRAVDRDDEVGADVEVEFVRGQPLRLVVVEHVVNDDEEIDAVVVDLRRVDQRVVAVIDGERVESEHVAEQRLSALAAIGVDVEPEEPAPVAERRRKRLGRQIEPDVSGGVAIAGGHARGAVHGRQGTGGWGLEVRCCGPLSVQRVDARSVVLIDATDESA